MYIESSSWFECCKNALSHRGQFGAFIDQTEGAGCSYASLKTSSKFRLAAFKGAKRLNLLLLATWY